MLSCANFVVAEFVLVIVEIYKTSIANIARLLKVVSMKTNKMQSSQPAESMVEYYSLGHKIVAVVLALVLMGFGWPAVNPSSIYAEDDAETEQATSAAEKKAEEKKAEEAKAKAEAEKKAAEEAAAKEKAEKEAAEKAAVEKAEKEAAEKKAAEEAAAKKANEAKNASSKSESSTTKDSDSSDSSKSEKEGTEKATEYDVDLDLGNVSIKLKSSKDQTVTAPATKVTVPADKDFKFTVETNEGYELTSVKLTVDGSKSKLTADDEGVYTVTAEQLAKGASLKFATEEKAEDAVNNDAINIASLDGEDAIAVVDEEGAWNVSGNDTLEVGKFAVYTANDFSGTVQWSSSDDSLATVDSNGIVTAVAAGSVTITATCGTEVASKTITITETASSRSSGYKATITPTIDNAEVAYFAWHNTSDTSSISFSKASGKVTINNYTTRSEPGYVVFFVKPNSNHIVTGLGASGNGDIYAVDASSWGNINGYPNIAKVMAAAKAAGYVAAFGYSRDARQSLTADFTISAKSPDMTVSAVSDRTEDVVAGDNLTFTVTIVPKTTGSGKDSVESVRVNSADVNGTTVEVENLTGNTDGTFTGVVHYTATDADVQRGSVVLTVNATSTYKGAYTISDGDISSSATVTKTATATCQIAAPSQVQYQFVSGTEGKTLPGAINAYLPSDSKSYAAGTTVKAKNPSETTYEDSKNNGYWTFTGWDKDSAVAKRDGDTITFTGTWTFTESCKYTVKYVDEKGNEIADPTTVSNNKVGDKIQISSIEKPEIKGYTYSKSDPSSTLTINEDESKNVITLIYKTKTGKAGYNLVLTDASWSAPEDTSHADKMKWYYNYCFAKGDTFEVTSSEPTAENHAFIGWMDKERGSQAAAIRNAGDTVTYCYNDDQTYTLDALWASLSAEGGEYVYDGTSHTISVDVNINEGTGLDPKYVEQAKKLIKSGTTQYSTDGGKTWTTEKPSFTNAGEHLVKVKQDVIVGGKTTPLTAEATVVITKRPVTFTGESATKAYNGSEQSITGIDASGLVKDQTYEGLTYEAKGTDPGEYDGAFTGDLVIKAGNDDVTANYEVTQVPGKLTISTSAIADYVSLTGTPVSKVYDAKAHEAGTARATDKNGHDVTIEYQKADGSWTKNPADITATAVADSTTVNIRASVPGYYEGYVEATEALTITPAKAVVNTESATKYYDGKPLTAGGSIALVGDETATVNTSDSQTAVGSKKNKTYEIDWKGTANEGNYEVVDGEFGTLTVKAQSIVPDPENPESYKGVEIGTLPDLVYNGKSQEQKPTVKDKEGKALVEGTDYVVSFSKDTVNVGTVTVTIKGTGNYTGTATRTYEITPKGYSVTTESATKTYDGTALTAPGEITGLISKDDATFTVTGSQTEVGESDNSYKIKFASDQMKANYKLDSEQIGKLVVTASDAMAVTASSYDGIYDGSEHGEAAVPSVLDGTTVEYSTDGGDTWSTDVPQVKDVAELKVMVRATNPNYNEATCEYTLKVTPAPLHIVTGSASKTYDGTALTYNDMSITGLVGNDAITGKTTGSQTAVGESANTYELTWGEVDANNYTITEDLGTLKVTAAPAVTPDKGDGGNDNGGKTNSNTSNNVSPAQAATNAVQNIVNTVTGGPTQERIYDTENPLGKEDAECWVHYYMIICMILTALYGLGVWAHRANYTRKLRKDMDDVMGDGDGLNPEKSSLPTTHPAGSEA